MNQVFQVRGEGCVDGQSSLMTLVVLGVQILVIKLPEHLEPSSTGASYFAVSISDEASIDAAGSLSLKLCSTFNTASCWLEKPFISCFLRSSETLCKSAQT